jgi:hypothetical protein
VKDNFRTQHDLFEVQQPTRVVVIRQDRVSVQGSDIFIRHGDEVFHTIDFTSYGLAVFSEKQLPEEMLDAAFVVENVEIGRRDLKKVRCEAHFHKERAGFKTAYVVLGLPLSVERALAVHEVHVALAAHEALFADNSVPEEFRLLAYEIKNWLSQLEIKIGEIELSTFEHPKQAVEDYEQVVTALVAWYIETNIAPLYKKIENVVRTLDQQTIKKCFNFFRASVGPFMYQSAYAHRAYYKPRGYAGDFEMMKIVYNNERRGKTLFGKSMEHYFVSVPEAQAVRNRAVYLSQKLKGVLETRESCRIMSLACGPAMEIQNLMKEQPSLFHEKAEIHLVDQDLEALKRCQKDIHDLSRQNNISTKFQFHSWAVKNIIETGSPIKEIDLVYSAGLFDYLSDPVAQYAARQLIQALRSNGHVVIGNFNTSAPNRFGMSLVTDWNLIYRTEDDLKDLFAPVARANIEQEPLGINLFAVLTRK